MNLRSVGGQGEAAAAQYLLGKGYRILDRNPHLRFSEIDILAEHNGTIVVVEVKTKKLSSHGLAVEQVTPAKKRRLKRLAEIVEQAYRRPVRVDVVAIDRFGLANQTIVHYENALE